MSIPCGFLPLLFLAFVLVAVPNWVSLAHPRPPDSTGVQVSLASNDLAVLSAAKKSMVVPVGDRIEFCCSHERCSTEAIAGGRSSVFGAREWKILLCWGTVQLFSHDGAVYLKTKKRGLFKNQFDDVSYYKKVWKVKDVPVKTCLLGYADEVSPLIPARNVEVAHLSLDIVIRRVKRWMKNHNLSLALGKRETDRDQEAYWDDLHNAYKRLEIETTPTASVCSDWQQEELRRADSMHCWLNTSRQDESLPLAGS